MTFGWAIISFVVYNYVGIAKHKWKYIYQFMGPSLWTPTIGGTTYHVRVLCPDLSAAGNRVASALGS